MRREGNETTTNTKTRGAHSPTRKENLARSVCPANKNNIKNTKHMLQKHNIPTIKMTKSNCHHSARPPASNVEFCRHGWRLHLHRINRTSPTDDPPATRIGPPSRLALKMTRSSAALSSPPSPSLCDTRDHSVKPPASNVEFCRHGWRLHLHKINRTSPTDDPAATRILLHTSTRAQIDKIICRSLLLLLP